jgi:L-seryl-tRNA(Ser) seleniumtransferase
VRDLVACTMTVGDAVRGLVGDRLVSTGVIVKILGESLLEMAEEHAGSNLIEPFKGRIAPIEATAVLSMLLLGEARDDHGAFRGVASGTSAMLIKFIPPELLARFGGADAFAPPSPHTSRNSPVTFQMMARCENSSSVLPEPLALFGASDSSNTVS